jgi:4-hydroxy-tetrahydrodipicolinate synthase
MQQTRFGLSCAVSTPFDRSGSVDTSRLAAHAKECLSRGCDSITLFGTTGEGASIGLGARSTIFEAVLAAGVTADQVLSTVVAASIEDASDQARMALDFGVRGLLLTPPFYFHGVSDEPLYTWFGRLFDRIGGRARDMFAYNLPSLTGVPISVDLVGKLKTAFPGVIVGVKDSSATWSSTKGYLKSHSDLMILVGDERDLARAVRLGGSGSISGLANIAADILRPAAKFGVDDPRIRPLVEAIIANPVLPAIKAILAARKRDAEWRRMRPPLAELDERAAKALNSEIDRILDAPVAG